MKAQFTNQVLSSFLMYVDDLLTRKGQGFFNYSGYFYPTLNSYNGYYSYASPFAQIVYDKGLAGSIPFSGVYLDRTFITTGQSGLAQIDYKNGRLYFNQEITGQNRISGSFSAFEFSTYLTSQPEQRILFETKKFYKPKITQAMTGVDPNEVVFPSVFIRENGGRSDPFAFGGMEASVNEVRMVVLGDSQFNTDAVTSIFKDQTRREFALLSESEFPFNAFGGLSNGSYNYTGAIAGKISNGSGVWIKKVRVIPLSEGFRSDLQKLGLQIFPALVDFTLETARVP